MTATQESFTEHAKAQRGVTVLCTRLIGRFDRLKTREILIMERDPALSAVRCVSDRRAASVGPRPARPSSRPDRFAAAAAFLRASRASPHPPVHVDVLCLSTACIRRSSPASRSASPSSLSPSRLGELAKRLGQAPPRPTRRPPSAPLASSSPSSSPSSSSATRTAIAFHLSRLSLSTDSSAAPRRPRRGDPRVARLDEPAERELLRPRLRVAALGRGLYVVEPDEPARDAGPGLLLGGGGGGGADAPGDAAASSPASSSRRRPRFGARLRRRTARPRRR